MPVANATARPQCGILRHSERRSERVRHRAEVPLENTRQLIHVLAGHVSRMSAQSSRELVGADAFVEPESQQADHQCCPKNASTAPLPIPAPSSPMALPKPLLSVSFEAPGCA